MREANCGKMPWNQGFFAEFRLAAGRLFAYTRKSFPISPKPPAGGKTRLEFAMKTYRIVWEDEAKAREVEILAHYTVTSGLVQVEEIRPIKVTLYNAQTKQPERTLPVHTAAGRRLLRLAYFASREESLTLADEIQAQLHERDALVGATLA